MRSNPRRDVIRDKIEGHVEDLTLKSWEDVTMFIRCIDYFSNCQLIRPMFINYPNKPRMQLFVGHCEEILIRICQPTRKIC